MGVATSLEEGLDDDQPVREHGPALAAWVAYNSGDVDAVDRFEDAYLGEWDSTEAYAEELLEDLGLDTALDQAVPDSIRAYVTIDIEALARDLDVGGDVVAIEKLGGGVWLFSGHD